jgi:O-methyltransferase involved in polyketide biosynthesis
LERRRQYLRGTGPDIPELWFIEERTDLRQWLTERGWAVTAIEALNLMQRYDRPPDDGLKDLAPRSVFIEGRLNTARRCS